MAKTSKTQFAVLGMLGIKPMSGYEIKQMMEQSTNHFWKESNGQLYPTLAKLSEENLVTFKEDKVGEKQRKIYSITESGMDRLQTWLRDEVEQYPSRNELLLKLFFGNNVSPEVSIQHIKRFEAQCQENLILYADIDRRLEAMVKKKERPVYYWLTVKAGIQLVQAELEWCRESIELIRKYA